MLLLLPPSEGKASGGTRKWNPGGGSFRSLADPRRQVADALAGAMSDEETAQRLLGLKQAALQEARAANASLVFNTKALPAHQRYSGVVWSYLDNASFTAEEQAEAERSVVVVSGLMGVVGWDDPVPMYKAKMGLRLAGVGALANFWYPRIGRALRSKYRGEVGINLLPQDCARAVDFGAIGLAHRFDVRFVDRGRKAVGHNAKAAKGALARALLRDSADPAATIATFAFNEWSGDAETDTADGVTVLTVVAR